MRQLIIFSSLALLMCSATLYAQAETAVSSEEAAAAMKAAEKLAAEGKVTEGWKIGAKVGLSGSFLQNSNFVGQADGVTMQFGGLLSGNANFRRGSHDWQNTLSIEHAQLKSPTIDSFIKSADALELKSLYLFRIPSVEWLGPYARARAFTQIFPGYGITAEDAVLSRTDGDTTSTEGVKGQERFNLTSWFEPLIFEEAIGGFVSPVDTKAVSVTFTAGLGSQQVFTQGGFAVADDEDTPELELVGLTSVFSVGGEAGVDAKGVLVPEVLSWNANAGVYYPFINSQDAITGIDLLHITAGGGLSLKVSKWVAVDYALRIIKQPFVLQDYQIQNQLLITSGFDLL